MEKIIGELIKLNIKTAKDLMAAKRRLAKKFNASILSNSEILKHLKGNESEKIVFLRRLLRKRAVRTMSGIAPVAVLTAPHPCPGKCVYCPTEKGVPQSYLSNEPAVMRAIRCGYNPYAQTRARLRALEDNGHEPTKIELIVIGGTWSVLPEKYKFWYIKECFRAANEFEVKKLKVARLSESKQESEKYSEKLNLEKLKKELSKEQKKNEKTKYKIIGITLETRPDYINERELWEMRELGCTRVELGVQAIDDEILKLNKRGHDTEAIAHATALLKNFGFKATYHVMPGLPGSTPVKDLKMFKRLFEDERFQPDQIKFYPTVVTRGSLLYKWWRAGKYKPYNGKVLEKLIMDCKAVVPEYVRIIRLIRDIPGESIVAGNLTTNLRQVMKDRGVKCRCIRCREAGEKKFKVESLKLEVIEYKASGGEEYFIQAVDKKDNALYGFCRLRLPARDEKSGFGEIFKNGAIVRELHVYGELVSVGDKNKKTQHVGLGRMLMAEAESIASEKDYKKMLVISGVGARGYYRKLGYRLKDGYMVKIL